ncbi:MAG: hypothetical protein PHE24_06030 [Patescibacteria group bacterium]|nr:hypothetical protein [Patescibacteria group bacterium]
MKNKKIYILIVCLAVLLTGCGLNLERNKTEKAVKPKIKNEAVTNNVATSSEKVATNSTVVKNEKVIEPEKKEEVKIGGWYVYDYDEVGISFKHPELLSVALMNGYLNSNGLSVEEHGFVDQGEVSIYGRKIIYDKVPQPDMDVVGLSKKIAEKLLSNSSCTLLNSYFSPSQKNDTDFFYLPHSFSNPNLCGVVKKDGYTIFYVIGIEQGYEAIPRIGSSILILRSGSAVILAHNLLPDLNKELDAWKTAYYLDHPNASFPNKEWDDFNYATRDRIDQLIKNPTKKINDNFILLGKIADSIVLNK